MKEYIKSYYMAVIIALTLVVSGCQNAEKPVKAEQKEKNEKKIEIKTSIYKEKNLAKYFQGINGCAVFYKTDSKEYELYNEELCRKRSSPCSTFKIISSCIGMEYGILKSIDDTMGYDGTVYNHPEWNDDITLENAFRSSCIWYFRKVIDAAGKDNVQKTLDDLNYGNRDISQWEGNGANQSEALNGFWLESSLLISPLEQTEVMKNIIEGDAFSSETKAVLEKIMLGEEGIYGKTGTGYDLQGRCIDGWFVGWFYSEERIYFAIRLEDTEAEDSTGNKAREIAESIIKNEYNKKLAIYGYTANFYDHI